MPRSQLRPPALGTHPFLVGARPGRVRTPAQPSLGWLTLALGLAAFAVRRQAGGYGLRASERAGRVGLRLGLVTVLLFGVLLATLSAPACGGGNGGLPIINGTPAGTYPLVVTATLTSGATTVTRNVNLSLTVN